MCTNRKNIELLAAFLLGLLVLLITAALVYPSFVNFGGKLVEAPFLSSTQHLVNINTAPKEELALLPGIGDKTAEKIVAYREEHGDFKTLEGLLNVAGIGKKTLEKIRPFISL